MAPGSYPARETTSTRTRSFGGCATCRNRHVKCDEGRPVCTPCVRSGVFCEGYENSVVFDLAGVEAKEPGNVRFRRPLLTELERRHMSEWLTASVPPNLVLKFLSELDDQCENAPARLGVQITRGPFMVFRIRKDDGDSSSSTQGDVFDYLPLDGTGDGTEIEVETNSLAQQTTRFENNDFSPFNDHACLEWSPSGSFCQPDYPELIPETLTPNLDCGIPDSDRIQEICESVPDSLVKHFAISPYPAQPHVFGFSPSAGRITDILCSPTPSVQSSTSITKSIPPDAVFLLRHYSTHLISLLTSLRHSKTPWHILFLPFVKQTLASLTLNETPGDSGMCAFYGTLAISAFSLSGLFDSATWLGRATSFKQHAREHARQMLRTAYATPKAAKYKSVLMALLVMVRVSILSGNRDQADCYLLESERLIRLRGLPRPAKSRKMRFLHHCYAMERLLHETTSVAGSNSEHRRHVRVSVASSGLVVRGQDSMGFRLPGWGDIDQLMLEVKTREVGENDLHLERVGAWPASLYEEIFGIPEQWVLLLSLVIRLGHEKDEAEKDDAVEPLSLRDFLVRANAIERRITQLRKLRHCGAVAAAPGSRPERGELDQMLDAMQDGLTIYFYRRIHNVDCSTLQPVVLRIRNYILSRDEDETSGLQGSFGLGWVAFIAACEADDGEVQDTFSSWFENSAKRSGLLFLNITLGVIKRVWKEKSKGGSGNGTSRTWLDLMKEDAMLCHHI